MQAKAIPIETLFRTYYARLCHFAARLTGEKELAEDLVQDVFLKCWNANVIFTEEARSKSYLYTAVRNACLNQARHLEVTRKFANDPTVYGEEALPLLDEMIRTEVLANIYSSVEQLPEGCRQVLKLAYIESMKNEEIAAHLGISVNTVKTQKARALKLLRLRLDIDLALLLLILNRFLR